MDKEKTEEILRILEADYGNPGTALCHSNPFELLVATILSAQCTDERVNKVTPMLFKKFGTAEKMSRAEVSQVEELIKSCGLYRNKAKNIVAASKLLVERFSGKVPADMQSLLELPGVGRKTANVILSNAFDKDAIAVDTHVLRVSKRLGLAEGNNPLQTEKELMDVIPKEQWSQAHHWLIYHGRNICKARTPACSKCRLSQYCRSPEGVYKKVRINR